MARSIRNFTQTLSIKSLPSIRIRSNRTVQVSLVVAALLGLACLHIWQRVQVMTLVHQTALLRQENRRLVDASTKLEDDIVRLSCASRIEQYARDTLNMIQVPVERFFTIIHERVPDEPEDELSQVFSSIKRVADHFPIVSSTQATAGERQLILDDSTDTAGTIQ